VFPQPFRISPTFSPRIWGSRSLAPIFPEQTGLAEPIGEAWLTDVRCRVANGPFAGRTLGDAWSELPLDWRGERCAAFEHFPLLVKFIFPADKLSIQVHPGDAYAAEHEQSAGGVGKTEMWHVVSAAPEARLLLGLKPGVTRKEFLSALGRKNLEELFETHTPEARDTFFIPAGIPHTIGPGMILCEVQQYSDLTYRVYDYGRTDAHGKPRELHLEKALEVIRFAHPPVGRVRPLEWASAMMNISLLAACRYFASERWRIAEPFDARPKTDAFNLLVVLAGEGEIRWATGKARYHRGDCWFLPASLRHYELLPSRESVFLRTFLPDLEMLRRNLRMLGVPDSQIQQVMFE